ncbi:hypothetical protein B0H19DRAFT_1058163 [Mycena capillaripes]|nr:hypothetical protein B0H19DRAFT_1058163 [Mycena capillaripes]
MSPPWVQIEQQRSTCLVDEQTEKTVMPRSASDRLAKVHDTSISSAWQSAVKSTIFAAAERDKTTAVDGNRYHPRKDVSKSSKDEVDLEDDRGVVRQSQAQQAQRGYVEEPEEHLHCGEREVLGSSTYNTPGCPGPATLGPQGKLIRFKGGKRGETWRHKSSDMKDRGKSESKYGQQAGSFREDSYGTAPVGIAHVPRIFHSRVFSASYE